MDMSLRDRQDAPLREVQSKLEEEQARRFAEFFRMFRRNKDRIDAVLFWGVNDENSWQGAPDGPLLFRRFQPKPAFWAVLREAKEELD